MSNSTLRSLGLRYKIVLAVLAGLSVGSFLILEGVIASQNSGAAEINIAGRQRMLSQRIGFLFSQVINAPEDENKFSAIGLLDEAILLMERSHAGLINGEPSLNLKAISSAKIRAHYFGPTSQLDEDVKTFLGLAKNYLGAILSDSAIEEHQQAFESFNTEILLEDLNRVVARYQFENEEKVSSLNFYQIISVVLSLVVLLVSWLGVFRPMISKINEYIGRIFEQGRSIRESEERFRSISESASMAMIVAIDAEGRVISWNNAAQKLFGYSRDEMLGKPLITIIPERYRDAHSRGFAHACGSDDYKIIGKSVELSGLHKNGHEFPVELSLGVWVQDGKKFFSGIVHDISDRKAAEAELIHARDVAQSASQTKTDFLANMSHELRTPLNGILGFSQMMKDELYGSLGHQNNKAYVVDIHRAGQYLLKLVNEILDISKIEAGGISLVETEVDVASIIESCVSLGKGQIAASKRSLFTDIGENLPALWADQTRIEQIFNNLISNAIKFTPAGGEITVRANLNGDGDFIIQVVDNGIGIRKEDIPKVLMPFEQVENIMTRTHEGSGLGLPLVKYLVEAQGGLLDIDSQIGHGTTVTVHFPKSKTVR
ncbi:MAG: PAS domain S-box protein [Rhodospirillales bacterium]|nr:PAS domain S-box protein [Rhodospirillales bacterium]